MGHLIALETDRVRLDWGEPRAEPAPPPGARPSRIEVRPLRPGLDLRRFELGATGPLAGPRVLEDLEYPVLLRAVGDGAVTLHDEEGLPLAGLTAAPGGAGLHGHLDFGTRVGRTCLELRLDGVPELVLEVEVLPSRLDYEDDYARMLRELQEFFAALALEYLRTTHQLGSTQRAARPTSLEWLTLLRYLAERLENALRHIAERPRRGLVREERLVRTERVRRVDAALRAQVRRGAGAGARRRLEDGLVVRRRLHSQRAEPTLDTPEHRWLRSQLEQIHRKARDLRLDLAARAHHAALPGMDPDRAERELGELEGRLARALRLDPFVEACGPPPAGYASLQLLHAPGYREAYRACLLLALGLRIHDGPLRPGIKELDTLYGYWSYVTLLREVSQATGQPVPPAEFFAVRPQGLVVRLRAGQQSQAQFAQPGGRKVTVTYQPELPLPAWMPGAPPGAMLSLVDPRWPTTHLLLDTRYRVEVDDQGAAGPAAADLRRLHAWRDASCQPHWSAEGEDLRPTVLGAALAFPDRPSASTAVRAAAWWRGHADAGVGALPLLPGGEGWLREWLAEALAARGWAGAGRALAHGLRLGAQRAREMAREVAAVLPVTLALGQRQLRWIQEHGHFPLPLEADQALPWNLRWLAFWSAAPGGGAGRLWRARVRGMRLVPWERGRPPWGPRRSPSDLGLAVELGAWQPVGLPAEAQRAVAHEPWSRAVLFTSRLALERARRADELLLASPSDWSRYEAAEAAGEAPRVVRLESRLRLHLGDGRRLSLDDAAAGPARA